MPEKIRLDTFALEFIDRVERTKDQTTLISQLSAAIAEFGFTSFLVTGLPHAPTAFSDHTILNGWPTDWYRRYNERNYYNVDGVAIQARQSVHPFFWTDVVPKKDNELVSAAIMGEAHEFGLTDGLLVPIYSLNGDQSCISMAGKTIDKRYRVKQVMHMISMYVHHRAISLHEHVKPSRAMEAVRLTLRERECLQWAACGKTDWEMGRILQISEKTVALYVGSAMKKLSSANRTQAVAKAILGRHINL
jgi:LuxR family transcriptional regulator, quorum-sensing system regulator BjaR1